MVTKGFAFAGHDVGFSFVELVVVLGITTCCIIWILSMGQANRRLSSMNREYLATHQLVTEILEYYANSLDEAQHESSDQPRDWSYFHERPGLHNLFDPELVMLMQQMRARITLRIEPDPEFPVGSGEHYTDLYYLSCALEWTDRRGHSERLNSTLLASILPR